jgi:hypothetical protein
LVMALVLGLATAPSASAECRLTLNFKNEGRFYKKSAPANNCVAGSGYLKYFTDINPLSTGAKSGNYECKEVVAGETGYWDTSKCDTRVFTGPKYVWAFAYKGEEPWEECTGGKEKETPTKYTSDECHEAAKNNEGKWEWSEATETEKVRGVGFTLTLTDAKATGGPSKVRCTKGLELTGWVSGGGGDVETAEVSSPSTNCERIEGGCKEKGVEKVKGVHLPWMLASSEGETGAVVLLNNGGSGEPGWEIVCSTLIGKTTDVCETESTEKDEEARLKNVFAGGVSLVTATLAKKYKGKCSVGGVESGEQEGEIALLDKSGTGLREQ